jgi:hypothetical protein
MSILWLSLFHFLIMLGVCIYIYIYIYIYIHTLYYFEYKVHPIFK